jgi:membrane protease YdiL (CAAX protease family)
VVVPDNVPFLDVPGAAPATRGDAGMWLLFAALGYLVGQVVGLLVIDAVAALLGDSGQVHRLSLEAVPPEWYIASSLLGLWTGFFGAPLVASIVRGTGHFLSDLGLRFRWIDLAGIVIGIGGQVLVWVIYRPFESHLHNFNGPTNKLTGAAHGGGIALIAVLTIVGAPFFEELFFRGLFLKGLVRVFAPIAPGPSGRRTLAVAGAVVVDGLVFGLAHGELEQLAGLAAFGIILAVVSYRTGRLGMNMVAHATFNALALYAVFHGPGSVVH